MKTKNYQYKKSEDNSFVINFTIPSNEVGKHKNEVLKNIQKDFDLKGFRKGNVPLDIIEQNVDKSRILEEAASHVISDEYNRILDSEKLHPIIQPQIKVKNTPITEGKDWEIEIIGCEVPPIEINPKYSTEVKKINQKTSKIVTSSKDDKKTEEKPQLDQILDALMKNIKVNLPEILLNAEIQSHISRLIDQTQKAGITVDQYLKSKNLTPETYQNQVKSEVINEWSINLAFGQIAKEQNMKIEKEEVDSLVKENPALAENLNLAYYLIQQQKVVDFLKNL